MSLQATSFIITYEFINPENKQSNCCCRKICVFLITRAEHNTTIKRIFKEGGGVAVKLKPLLTNNENFPAKLFSVYCLTSLLEVN